MMTVFIILLLIVLNGLFVAAEFALLGAPRAALEQMGVSGNMVARRVSQILKTPRLQDRYIATAQLGVTFASLGLGMYGEHAVAGWLHEWLAQYGWASWLVAHGAASILSVAVLTYLHIVLGEMVPKALSLQYAAKLCLIIAMPMYVIQLCLYPLVVGMNALGNFFLGLLGVDRNESKNYLKNRQAYQYNKSGCRIGHYGVHPTKPLKQREQIGGQFNLSVCAQNQTGNGNAELASRNVAVQLFCIFQNLKQMNSHPAAVLRHFPDHVAAYAHCGEFCCNIKGVDQNQKKNNESDKKNHVCRGVRKTQRASAS